MFRSLMWAGSGAWAALLICGSVIARAEAASSTVTPTVLATPEIVPQSYTVNGEQTGFLVDIINEAFRRAGRPVEIRLLPWARCLSETQHGSIDGFFPAFVTPARLSYLGFSQESVMIETVSLFVREGSPISFDGDLSKLAQSRIGLVYKTSYGPRFDAFLTERRIASDEPHGSLQNSIRMLAGGRIDLVPGDRQTVIRTAASLGLSNRIVELSPPIEMVPAYLAYTRLRDLDRLGADIDRSLRTMKEDGFYEAKLRQYYPQ
jgi:polar amino acid transport system substrate-binding protein